MTMTPTIPTVTVLQRTATQLTATITDQDGASVDGASLTSLTLAVYTLDYEAVGEARDVQGHLVAGTLTTWLLPDELDLPEGMGAGQRLVRLSVNAGTDTERHLVIEVHIHPVPGVSKLS